MNCTTEPAEKEQDQGGGRCLHRPIALTGSAASSPSCSGTEGALSHRDHGHWCPLPVQRGPVHSSLIHYVNLKDLEGTAIK